VSDALARRLQSAEAERTQLMALQAKARVIPGSVSLMTIERRAELLLQRIGKGGDIARSALREIFPNAISLQPDPSGLFLWALFRKASARHCCTTAPWNAAQLKRQDFHW
jgi:DNA-binding transcriptional MocR family regulator